MSLLQILLYALVSGVALIIFAFLAGVAYMIWHTAVQKTHEDKWPKGAKYNDWRK